MLCAQMAQERLDQVLAEEQQELMRMTILREALEAAEMEYVRLCRGLMRLEYSVMDDDTGEADDPEGGVDDECLLYE